MGHDVIVQISDALRTLVLCGSTFVFAMCVSGTHYTLSLRKNVPSERIRQAKPWTTVSFVMSYVLYMFTVATVTAQRWGQPMTWAIVPALIATLLSVVSVAYLFKNIKLTRRRYEANHLSEMIEETEHVLTLMREEEAKQKEKEGGSHG